MMRSIYLYEYALAGGAWGEWHDPALATELRTEGAAMAHALADDLLAAGFEVELSQPGASDAERESHFEQACRRADGVWLIAPELRGILWALARHAESLQARLLSPGASFIQLTQDKHDTAEWLRARGVPAPAGLILAGGDGWPRPNLPWSGPAVRKPRDGAGSADVLRWDYDADGPLPPGPWRVEQWCPGISVSVAAICCGPAFWTLAPCAQRLGGPAGLQYLGGTTPLSEPLAARATRLAHRALQALPPGCGYVGLDLVLGDAPDGSGDTVIEVNPRLTTSYVGLRRAARENLAAATISTLLGGTPLLTWRPTRLEFAADGRVWPSTALTSAGSDIPSAAFDP